MSLNAHNAFSLDGTEQREKTEQNTRPNTSLSG